MHCLLAVPCDEDRRQEVLATVDQWPGNAYADLTLLSQDDGRIDPVWRMQQGLEIARDGGMDVIAYLHSDVEIYETGWLERALAEFANPSVGVVGFGGALRLGHPDLYKTPYRLEQLARFSYRSNTVDADFHGEREVGACDVATLDGFCLLLRRELLDRVGGWPTQNLQFHNYDNWLCCMARRLGYRTRMVGVSCKHLGGGHSVKARWQERCLADFGCTDAEIHRRAHRWLYDSCRDVLPFEVAP